MQYILVDVLRVIRLRKGTGTCPEHKIWVLRNPPLLYTFGFLANSFATFVLFP